MRTASLLILLCTAWAIPQAQNGLERKVVALFDSKFNADEIAYYHGRFDHMQEILIAIGCENKDCRGVLRYIRSKEELVLKGTLKKEVLELEEINNFGKISGYLNGSVDANGISGWWSDPERERYISLEANRVNKLPEKATHCGKNKWIRYFTQVNDPSKIIVQKSSDQAIAGTLFLAEKNQSFHLEGGITNDGHYELQLFDEEIEVGQLAGNFNEKGEQNIVINWENGKTEKRKFLAQDRLLYGCMEYGDFLGYYAMTFPLTRHERYNTWMEKQVSNWASASKTYAQEVRNLNPNLEPQYRASIQANAWTDISYFDGQLISGMLNYTNNWSSENNSTAFIFNLKNGELINPQGIFKNGLQVENLLAERKRLILSKNEINPEFQKWIASEKFDLLNIHFDGFSFASNFHPIFGQETILISIEEMKPFLNAEGPLQHYID